MILIDTNIISELMKLKPDVKVLHWLNQQETDQLFITTVSIAEIMYGLQSLPDGKRRYFLEIAFEKAIEEGFRDRILAFDEEAARVYGRIMAHRKKLGRPMSILDGQIAAIAFVFHCKLATRNIKDFQNCDLELINPF